MSNVRLEKELYPPMCDWLRAKLEEKYQNKKCNVIVEDVSTIFLDRALTRHGIINHYPQVVGLGIQIDVLGIVKYSNRASLFFIEAKKTPLNLHDLGQLWAYCKLCEPDEAILLSSAGLGSLNKVLNNLGRLDLLEFGEGKVIKNMQVAKWDIERNMIDYNTLVPKV